VSFVGRARALSLLLAAVEEAAAGRARVVLVVGEAGIGKTALVSEVVARSGWAVGWGTCADADRAPAFWAWAAALRGLVRSLPADALDTLGAEDAVELARLLPELAGSAGAVAEAPIDTEVARLRLFDAAARFLERLAHRAPTFVVLDDLQWADPSTLALLRFVAQPHRPVPLMVIGIYRHDELTASAAEALVEVAARADTVSLTGLAADEVAALVADTAGAAAADRWAEEVHRRTQGHPFFARQLTELLVESGATATIPAAVHDLLARRVRRLSAECRAMVEAAAVAGNDLLPDVLAEVSGTHVATVARLIDEGLQSGVLVRDAEGHARLGHDLFRETVVADLPIARRLLLHQRIAEALEHRQARGGRVVAADVAGHSAAAAALGGPERAVRWARRAAAAERGRLAYAEAAAHLARARRAVEETGAPDAAGVLVDLLVEEADATARVGDSAAARALLADARGRAVACGDAERQAQIALGVQQLGSRFAMPRDDVVEELDAALAALRDSGSAWEARLTACLARELHHSVPAQRPRARPLSERALALARTLDDPTTLAACLLARHDVLWTPGRAPERTDLAREITQLAERCGDAERRAEGLLLTANGLLEQGSVAFRAVLDGYLHAADGLHQPRHDYLAMTRRGALALIDGRLDDAERLITASIRLGERIGEPDTGNVRMSQLLGLVRARGHPEQLRATAAEAIRWWLGVPSHAHAVAAGFLALAGEPDDLEAARKALATVLALDTWREDRSYLWSVFVGEMTTAAVRLGDRDVCAQLLTELTPVVDACGVNGALVCFMGSNAHWAGMLAAALGSPEDARRWLGDALEVHRRLGAAAWEAETSLELAVLGAGEHHAERAAELAARLGLGGVAARLADRTPLRTEAPRRTDAELCRDGDLWRVRHHGESAHLRDVKGLSDLAVLLARPGVDVHVLDLAGAGVRDSGGDAMLDMTALAAYRDRLAELDADLDTAQAEHDHAQAALLGDQRTALLDQLRRAAGSGGRTRTLGTSTTERARKAVTARLRDAIHRISGVLPDLGAHLDRSVLTGTTCRYDPAEGLTWTVRGDR
jgi:DNA-binding NarL/FixJ family response regulator